MKSFFNVLMLCLATTGILSADHLPQPTHFGPKVTLNAGTLILLETNEQLFSDDVTVGKVFHFRVTTNVMAEGKCAITSGALAVGRVKAIQESTYNGAEEIRIEMMYVQAVDGQMVPLHGNEQTFKARFPNEGTPIETGTFMTAQVMNNIKIKVK